MCVCVCVSSIYIYTFMGVYVFVYSYVYVSPSVDVASWGCSRVGRVFLWRVARLLEATMGKRVVARKLMR